MSKKIIDFESKRIEKVIKDIKLPSNETLTIITRADIQKLKKDLKKYHYDHKRYLAKKKLNNKKVY